MDFRHYMQDIHYTHPVDAVWKIYIDSYVQRAGCDGGDSAVKAFERAPGHIHKRVQKIFFMYF